jgi:uroporphyrinogen decarboxylase
MEVPLLEGEGVARKDEMTHRERFLTAVKHGRPDRVPACPCLSYMVPAKRTERPFWDVFYYGDPPIWKAYLAAARYFGIDGRLIYGGLRYRHDAPSKVQSKTEIVSRTEDRLVTHTVITTPDGTLDEETVYPIDNPPTTTVKMIKRLKEDLPKVRHLYVPPTSYTAEGAEAMRREAGEDAVFCLSIGYPGFHTFNDMFHGNLEAAVNAYMDDPEPFEELRLLLHNVAVKKAEMAIDYRPDILYLSGSGTLHLSTPEWVRRFTLPTLQAVTRMAKQAGVPTMLHSCGRSRWLVEVLAEETDLDCMNPLEAPPMGDCDLAEIKARFGQRLSLAGNIHTSSVMYLGTPADVDRACREAIEAAGEGGGYVLMTGDQCGRDTPEENLFAFVEAAKRYGTYT